MLRLFPLLLMLAWTEWGGSAVALKLRSDGSRDEERQCLAPASPTQPPGFESAPGYTETAHRKYAYDNTGALLNISTLLPDGGVAATAGYLHDKDGRRTSEPGSTAQWNVESRLTQQSLAATSTVTNVAYDAMGLRRTVSATVGGVAQPTQNFSWAGGNGESEVAADNARVVSVAGIVIAQGGQRFAHDALGSTIARVDSSGTLGVHRYGVFGVFEPGSVTTPPREARYTNHAYAGSKTLLYAQQRYYDATTGQLLSEDPLRGDLMNPSTTWAYGSSNPMRFGDPDGRCDVEFNGKMSCTGSKEYRELVEWQSDLESAAGRQWSEGNFGKSMMVTAVAGTAWFPRGLYAATEFVYAMPLNAGLDFMSPFEKSASSGDWQHFDSSTSIGGGVQLLTLALSSYLPSPSANSAFGRSLQAGVAGGGTMALTEGAGQSATAAATGDDSKLSPARIWAAFGTGAVLGAGIHGATEAPQLLSRSTTAIAKYLRGSQLDSMSSFTASGSEVAHAEGVTRFGSDGRSVRVASNVAREGDFHDVVVHGDAYDDLGGAFYVDQMATNANQIAEGIRSNPSYRPGQPVRAVTCYGACGPAQELSNALGVQVRAATDIVNVPRLPNSPPQVANQGYWVDFFPSVK